MQEIYTVGPTNGKLYLSCLVCLLFMFCNSNEPETAGPVTKDSGLVTTSPDTATQRISEVPGSVEFSESKSFVKSGQYANVSVAYDSVSQKVSGVYEYYDKWNEEQKEYTDVNVFFFFGSYNADSTVTILSGLPGDDELIRGKLAFGKNSERPDPGGLSVRIQLEEQPTGYADVNFTAKQGVVFQSTAAKQWSEIRMIKVDKAKLYQSPDSSALSRGYLVNKDIVKIISSKPGGWFYIEFNEKNNSKKSSFHWIREEDLFDKNPVNW